MGWLSTLGINRKYFHKSALALGLTIDDRGTIEGQWGDIKLAAYHSEEHRLPGSDSSEEGYLITQYWAVLDPPLRMDLSLVSRSFLKKIADALRSSRDIEVGDERFDKEFWINGLDGDHVRAVLQAGNVMEAILAGRQGHYRLEICDRYVMVTNNGHDRSEADIKAGFNSVGPIALALRHARFYNRTAWEPELLRGWGAAAERLGLQLDADASWIKGRLGGVQVEAEVRVEQGLVTRAKARLPEPLGLALEIVREDRYMENRLWVGQDIEVGDPFFDEQFVVKGEPEAAVRQILTGEPTARLKDLLQRAEDVKVEGDAVLVWVKGALTDSAAIEHMLRATAECAEAFLSGKVGANPFR